MIYRRAACPQAAVCEQISLPLGWVLVRQLKKAKGENGHAFCQKRIAAFAAQGVQPLIRNAVTQNSPDIQVPGLFGLTERTYGDYPYRSAPLRLFDKLEFVTPTN